MTSCTAPIPLSLQDSQHLHGYPSLHSDSEQDITAQDCGLGITTDENIYTIYQHPSSGNDNSFSTNEAQDYDPRLPAIPTLASPFEHISSTPVVGWDGAYFCGTSTTSGESITQQTPPDGRMLFPHNPVINNQYLMSPGWYPGNLPDDLQEHDQFKYQAARHQSISPAPLLHTAIYPHDASAFDPSHLQWTQQTAIPDWHDMSQQEDLLQAPHVNLDYQSCRSAEQGATTLQSPETTRTVMTVPPRRKPHLRPTRSESFVPRLSAHPRMRGTSMGYFAQPQQHDQSMSGNYVQQLSLPQYAPSMLIHTLPPQMPAPGLPRTTTIARSRVPRSRSSTPFSRARPSSPPPSDFMHTNTPYLTPVRQEPSFPGDLYTPRYKRRTPNGRWEGWCGHCQPGRWLDLKNSRFWEDKLRNHGICAKTKMRFNEPQRIRWVSPDGMVLPDNASNSDGPDPYLDARKREGLCGVCQTWVAMDGMRTKARDRAVGWWMHAYKCHNHDKQVGDKVDAT